MDLNTLYHRTVECWATRVNAVTHDQWDAPTPCSEWTVRDLVNHITGEDRWTVPLMQGQTIEQVGTALEGDLLGDNPIMASLEAAKEAVSVVAERLPTTEVVHLSYGDEDPAEYLRQLAADHLIHAWDLAAATGGDRRLDPQVVSEVGAWFADREELMRSMGLIAPRQGLSGDAQVDLLAAFGRDAHWGPNHATLARFSAAFGAGDLDAVMALMTDDCVFESTSPAPDGRRYVGADAVRQVFEELFSGTPDPSFTNEDGFVCEDRGVLRWRFSWSEPDGSAGQVRGVDLLRFRGGKVAEKLSYVKG